MNKLIVVAVGVGMIAVAVAFNLDVFSVAISAECCAARDYSVPHAELETEKLEQPEFVPYMFLFQHIVNIKDDRNQLDELRNKIGLSKADFGKLLVVTDRYRTEVAGYDEAAQVIIDQFHRQYPPGPLPEGVGPGEPPQELIELQKRRDDAALRYRDELRIELGAYYEKFIEYVDSDVKTKIIRQQIRNTSARKEGIIQ